MSVGQAYKDYLVISAVFGVVLMLVFIFYQYFQTNDVKLLYFGIALLLLSAIGVVARYFYTVDYVWNLLKSWR